MAGSVGLDLVEVSSDSNPIVCKIMDHGKFLYEQKKKQKNSSKTRQLKQIEVRPSTDIGDLNVKVNNIKKFLLLGHKVKVSIKYKGREMAHKDIGLKKLNEILSMIEGAGVSDGGISLEGRKHLVTIKPS